MEAIVRTNCWMGNVQQKISLLMPTILHSNIESLMQEARPYFCKSFVDLCVFMFSCALLIVDFQLEASAVVQIDSLSMEDGS